MIARVLVNIIGFYAGWFACILGAGRGVVWIGPVVVACVVAPQVLAHRDRLREAATVVAVAGVGVTIDVLLYSFGLITFAAGVGVFAVWIGALWVNFAATLSVSLGWLARWPIVAGVIGAVSGPGTYALGVALGAIGFHEERWRSVAVLAAVWAVALPAALVVMRRIHAGAGSRERSSA